jgi:hypothetical protein
MGDDPVTTRPRPVLIAFAVMAALDVLTGGSALTDVIGKDTAGLIVLALAAAKVGLGFYVQGEVTPLADPRDADGAPLLPAPPGEVIPAHFDRPDDPPPAPA